jgi:hypothetical protein
VIDINLHQEPTYPLARLLRARSIPFLFTTGYDRSSVPSEFQDIPLWEKPINLPAMMRECAFAHNIWSSIAAVGGALQDFLSCSPEIVYRRLA